MEFIALTMRHIFRTSAGLQAEARNPRYDRFIQ